MKKPLLWAAAIAALLLSGLASAQVPQLINYQGRVAVGTVNFDGSGSFKFALVDAAGTTTYWSNDGTSAAGSEPTAAVALTVTKGLYSVLLGDTSAPLSMTAIPASVFANADVRLRVWFNDGPNGFQLLAPDQRLTPTAYISDGAVTSSKLANGAVGSSQLAPGTVFSWQNVSGTSQVAQPNTGYTANNAAQVTITLPPAPNIGDTVRVLGAGAGGWKVAPSAGQSVLGTSWTPNGPQKNWTNLAASADGTKLVAAAFNEFLYTSADSGVTWTARMTDAARIWRSLASSADGTKLAGVVGGDRVYISSDSGVTWVARTPAGSWSFVALSADGTKLAAAQGGAQIQVSTDSGVTWTPHGTGQTWQALCSSADGTKLAASNNINQVFTSADSGITWTTYTVAGNFGSIASSGDGTKLVATVSGGKIYTSSDSGATWTAHESNRSWQSVASSADGSTLVAVVGGGGQIYTSADSGMTWTARESNRDWQCAISSADGSYLAAGAFAYEQIYTWHQYLTGAQGSTAELQYIGNGQWQAMNQSLIASGAVGSSQLVNGAVGSAQLAVNAVQPANIAAGAGGTWQSVSGASQAAQANTSYLATGAAQTVFTLPTAPAVGDVVRVSGSGAGGWEVAPNAGQQIPRQWFPRDSNRGWIAVTSSSDGSKLAAVVYGGRIYSSVNSGLTWTSHASNQNWSSIASSSDGTRLVAVVNGGQIYTSVDSGVNWTAQIHAGTQQWSSVAASSDGVNLVAVAFGGLIYTSSDSGVNWTPQNGAGAHTWQSVASSSDGAKLVAATGNAQIYTSTDSGVNWTPRESVRNWNSVASSADGSKLVAVAASGFIYTSADSGARWAAQTGAGSRFWYSVASSSNGSNLAAVASSGQIYTSIDSGVTWLSSDSNRGWVSVASSSDGSKLAAVANGGLIYTSTSYLTGAQGSTADMQYIGNGIWQPLNQSQIAAGAVGNSQIAAGAVGNLQIAMGAVGNSQIATGAVGSSQIAVGAIGSANIAPGAIAGAQIAPNSITSANISVPLTLVAAANPGFHMAPDPAYPGVFNGINQGSGVGLYGESGTGGNGVWGNNASGTGVAGTSNSGDAMYAASNTGIGIEARSNDNYAIYAASNTGTGVFGYGKIGVHGQSSSVTDSGVWGENTGAGYGVTGTSYGYGVFGDALGPGGSGVHGIYDGPVRFPTEGNGVFGYNPVLGNGVLGIAEHGHGVSGTTNGGLSSGVFGYTQQRYCYGGFFTNTDSNGLALVSQGKMEVRGNLTVTGNITAASTNEQAYLGGDGVGGDVQIGSQNPGIKSLAAYNSASRQYMDFSCAVLHILGGSDLAEPFAMSSDEIPKGSVVVIDDEHPGRLKLSREAYDHRVAGIVSGANGINPGIALQQEGALEGGQNVALSGRVYVLADTSNGLINPGDLLTTSDTPGCAMKATDHDRAQGAIIGKAMSPLSEGRGMVLVLVSLQ